MRNPYDIYQQTDAEKAIRKAIVEVEKQGADPLLSAAVSKLEAAFQLSATHYDKRLTPQTPASKVYFADWEDTGRKQMIEDFKLLEGTLEGVTILFAAYTYESYSGDAFVLCVKDGKLYEVNGGHCSCYGLEEQWELEETTPEAIRQRLDNKNYGIEAQFKPEIKDTLRRYESGFIAQYNKE